MLVPQVAPDPDPDLDRLRDACDRAVAGLVAAAPDRVVVLASGERPVSFGDGVVPDFGDITADGSATGRAPLALRTGAWLLARSGVDLPVGYQQVTGRALDPEPGRTALLVMADGTATRSTSAPGYLDARAEVYDDSVGAALAAGDPAGLERLDRALGDALWASGVPALNTLGATVRAAALTPDPEVLYEEAPRGVAYWVATWRW